MFSLSLKIIPDASLSLFLSAITEEGSPSKQKISIARTYFIHSSSKKTSSKTHSKKNLKSKPIKLNQQKHDKTKKKKKRPTEEKTEKKRVLNRPPWSLSMQARNPDELRRRWSWISSNSGMWGRGQPRTVCFRGKKKNRTPCDFDFHYPHRPFRSKRFTTHTHNPSLSLRFSLQLTLTTVIATAYWIMWRHIDRCRRGNQKLLFRCGHIYCESSNRERRWEKEEMGEKLRKKSYDTCKREKEDKRIKWDL